jgi:hypothetical protein
MLRNCCNALSRAFTPRPARNEPGGNNAGGGPGALSVPHVQVRSAPLQALSPADEAGEREPLVFHAADPRPDAAQAPRSIVAAPHGQNRFVQLAMLKVLLEHLRTFLPVRDSLNLRSTWKDAPMHMPLSANIARARALLEPIALAQIGLVEATKADETANCGQFFNEMRALVKPFESKGVVKEEAQLCRTFLDLAEKVERGSPLTQQEQTTWAEVCKYADRMHFERGFEPRIDARWYLRMRAHANTAVKGREQRDDFLAAVKTVLAGIYCAGMNNGKGRLRPGAGTNDGYEQWKVKFGQAVEMSRRRPDDRSGWAAAYRSLSDARNKIDTDAVGFLLGMGFASADQENLGKCDRWLRNLQVGEGKDIKYPEVERVMREMGLPADQVNSVHVLFQTLLVPDLPGAKRLETLESLNTAVSALRDEIVLVAQHSLTRSTTRSSSRPYPGREEFTYPRRFHGVEQWYTHRGPDPHVHRFIIRDVTGRLEGVHIHAFNDPNAPD